MIKLIESGLFGNLLFKVDTNQLVNRYNSCLKDIGLPQTKLTSFHIDGWGWSPEVADELGDKFYLSHGLANPYGIIISPQQAQSSIYMPYHSFDRDLHEIIFQQYEDQITAITARCGLWFEIDQDISSYRVPQDLLMVDFLKVNFFSVDRVMTAAREQRALIREFNDKPHAWSNDDLRHRIIDSSTKYGDLRFQKFEMPSHPYNDIGNYYTLAFNGVYVFKKLNGQKPLLVFAQHKSERSGESSHGHVEYNLKDPALLSYLYNVGLITSAPQLFKENPILIQLVMDNILLKACREWDESIAFEELNRTQKKGIINKLDQAGLLSEDFFELERLLIAFKDNKPVKISENLSSYLLHPSDQLSAQAKKVMWQLLLHFNSQNPVLTYLFDKSKFYSDYNTWSDHQQTWTINQVLAHKHIFHKLI
jgi:hypothetical protein